MLITLLAVLIAPTFADTPKAPLPEVRTEVVDGGLRIVPDRDVPRDAREARELLLEFGDTSLYDLTLFFADVMRLNFMITDEKGLRSKEVQLIGHASMSLDAAWEAYLSALRAHGYTTAVVGDLVTLVPSKDAERRSESVRAGTPTREGTRIVTQLLPVENADVADLLQVVRPLLSSDAEVRAYAPANTLIVTDSESNVRKVAELVEQLSVAAPATTLRVVQVQHAEAAEMKAVLEALYPAEETAKAATAPRTRTRRNRKTAPVPTTPTATGTSRAHLSRVLADERTNRLIVLADPEGHAAVDRLLTELDVDGEGAQRLHVVRLVYATAADVEAVLTRMASGGGATSRPGRSDADPDLSTALEGARFAADEETNAIAVLADEAAFAPIRDLVEELDVVRRQVFVDAVFVELTSADGKQASGALHGASGNGYASSQLSDDISSFAVTADLLSGLAAGVFGELIEVLGPTGDLIQVPAFGIALQALQTDSDVNVMGNPALLVRDHGEAKLSVGRQIPYKSGTVLSSSGLSQETYDRIDVNTELLVTPHINATDLVTLDVELNVDEVDESVQTEGGGPQTSVRTVETDVMVQNGQTIVIAGVTSTKLEVIESKVPLLGDIPLLGALFRSRKKQTRNSNLLVFLTPHIVDHPGDLVRISRMKEAQRQEFVRRFQHREGQAWLDELNRLLADAEDRPAADDPERGTPPSSPAG